MKKKVLLLVLSAFCPLWALAQFSGQGSGTEEDPYQITDAIELYQVRSNISAHFILMNDIDLTDWLAENSPTSGWAPIGSESNPFKGTFDGNGKTIKYFTKQVDKQYVGLFAHISNATIKNLNVIGDVITSGSYIYSGGIVGWCKASSISNCTFRGQTSGSHTAGGIAGYCTYYSTIEKCSVAGTITADYVCGGVTGYFSQSTIQYCSVWAKILDFKTAGGGIVGGVYSDGTIYDCFFEGKIVAQNSETPEGAAGIIGETVNKGSVRIRNCIAIAPIIKGLKYVCGIVGKTSQLTSITNQSNVAIVDTIEYQKNESIYRIGAYVGSGNDGTSNENLALSSMVVIQEDSDKPEIINDGGNNGISMGRSMLKMSSTYTSHNFDMKKVWDIVEGKGYPYLRCAAEFMSIMGGSQNIPFEETDVTKLTDAIYANPVTAFMSSEATMTINLKNAQTTNGYSFDLKLPEGVTLAKNDNNKYLYSLSNRHNDHSATVNHKEATGVYSFVVMSLSSTDIKESDGTIMTLTLNISDEMTESDYAVKVQNAKYSLSSGATSVAMEDVTSLLTIENHIKGDANGDTMVDIADAVCIVNHIVGKATPIFIEAAADANGDGVVDIADAVRIVNLIVGKIDALAREHDVEWNLSEPE